MREETASTVLLNDNLVVTISGSPLQYEEITVLVTPGLDFPLWKPSKTEKEARNQPFWKKFVKRKGRK